MKSRGIAAALMTLMALGITAHGRRLAHASSLPSRHFALQTVDGKEVYLQKCKECHGVIGAPTKASLRKYEKIPNFTDPEFFKAKKDADLLDAVEKGKGRDMKGFADKLSKDEIKAVVAYIHTLEKKR